MFKDARILAVVPARKGSRGIPNKNIVDFCGKPLLAWTIEAARASHYIDEVIVSTDDEAIADVAHSYKARVPFIRPGELARDTSTTIEVVCHTLSWLEAHDEHFDVHVLLQPTSPLRTSASIDAAIELFFAEKRRSVVSVTAVHESPLLMRRVVDGRAEPYLDIAYGDSTRRRQDMEELYIVDGCIYVNNVAEITPTLSFNDNEIAYVLPYAQTVQIDEPQDLALAAYYYQRC